MIKINDNLSVYFPLKHKPREQQIKALKFINNSINNQSKFMLLNLPTGVGKSYFSNMFINWYKNFINKNAKFDILTNSKILQDQYISEFDFIANFKGKSNYYCDPYDTNCENGKEICVHFNRVCEECPYDIAKQKWLSSEVSLTNFHLFNTLSIYNEGMISSRNSNVLIIDEAHDFESNFCSFISIGISAKLTKNFGFELSEMDAIDDSMKNIKTIHQFVSFLEYTLLKQLISKKDKFKRDINNKNKDKFAKYISSCEHHISKINYFLTEFEESPENWVLDITKNKDEKHFSGILLEAKPVWGNDNINNTIFKNYDHVLFMSASILNKVMFSKINGLDLNETNYFDIPSPFNVNNRKIYYLNVGKMSYNSKVETFKKQVVYIKKILKKYSDKKGIIHCNSYEISNWIQEQIHDKRLLFHKPEDRDEILSMHIESKEPTIIVSPSMVSGVDLKDDLSRFQIILKIPYPFLGSNTIKKRKETYPEWYSYRTVCDLIQMCGRSIRNECDTADSYVIDGSFSDLMRYSGHIFPKWFLNSVINLKV